MTSSAATLETITNLVLVNAGADDQEPLSDSEFFLEQEQFFLL